MPEQAERRWVEETKRAGRVSGAYTALGHAIDQARDAAVEYGPGHPRAVERLDAVLTHAGALQFEVGAWRASQVENRSEREGDGG